MVYTPDHTDTDTDTDTDHTPPPLMVVETNTHKVETTAKKLVSLRHRNTARNGHGKKRTRPVYKLAKRQDNLELSYLCRTFVSLKEWQGKPTKARQGDANKARQVGVVTTPRQVSLQLGDARLTIWNCHIFVVPLYRCRNTN